MIHDPNPKILDLIQSLLTMNWMAMESKDCLAFVRQLLKKVELEQVVVVVVVVVVVEAAVAAVVVADVAAAAADAEVVVVAVVVVEVVVVEEFDVVEFVEVLDVAE